MSKLKLGDSLHGFTVTAVDDIPEYRGTGIRLRHNVTGADLYHLNNDDKENLFSFAFKTPASDNTGVSHILEHCTLAGSKKYPIKDPFLSMMNGSMNTFLNAMTYPDKTVYPAASPVKKDYFNLLSVYADAVFFPLLREEMFMQEGIRFEPGEDGKAVASGVVFNEMKGAYSNHDSIAAEYSYRFMFPDTAYQYDSGGEPSAIPLLSYQEYRDFQKRFYHPSNCRIFLYGDIDTEEQLEFLQENALSQFNDTAEPAPELKIQPVWDSPKAARITSPLSSDGDDADDSGATLTINWKGGSTENSLNILALEILTEALMGNMGAPLYKAVVESGIGEDLSPVSGVDTDLREMVFTIGVRGSSVDKEKDFEKLVFGELKKLVDEGIPELSLKGAIHRVEFRNREIKGGAPFGLRLMGRSLKGWLHGGSPSDTIGFKDSMAELKMKISDNPRFFEDLVEKWLLNNNHRIMLSIEPDKDHNKIMDKKISDAVAAAEKDLSKFESFRAFQAAPDSKELLAKIPSLELEDVPKEIRNIKTERMEISNVPLYRHDLFTNGIIYIDFAIDIRDISDDEGLLLPFLSRMICSSGLPGRSYDQVALDLALKTGGLYTFLESSRTAGGKEERKDYLFFRLKTLESDLDEAFDLAVDLMINSEVSDPARVKDLLFEMRNDFKSSIVPSGHSFCAVKAASQFDRVLEREDEWRGSRQFLYLNELTVDSEKSIPLICKSLGSMRDSLFTRSRLTFNITCENGFFNKVQDKLQNFLEGLKPGTTDLSVSGEPDLKRTPSFNLGALSVPSSVYFTARTMPAASLGSKEHSHQSLLAHMMKTNDLWEEVRMKNGAYGVYASVNGTEGLITISTYRDPNPGDNLNAFESALKAAAAGRYTALDLKKAIITVVGRDLKPLSPAEESLIGFRRDLYRISDEMRQQKRVAMLETTVEDVKAAAAGFLSHLSDSVAVVMGPEELISAIAVQHGKAVIENTIVLPM